jgi:hypothetical protein
LLMVDEVPTDVQGGVQPCLAGAGDVVLEATDSPLNPRDPEQIGGSTKPRRRPVWLEGLCAQVEEVPGGPAGLEAWTHRQIERSQPAERWTRPPRRSRGGREASRALWRA